MTGDDPRDSEFWVPPLRGAYSEPDPEPPRRVVRPEAESEPISGPPARPRRSIVPLTFVLALLILVPLTLVVFGGSSDSEDAGGGGPERPQTTTTTTGDESTGTTEASATSDTTAPLAPEWQLVEDPAGRFRLALPPTLVSMALDGDTAGLGLRMFPTNANLASKMEQIAGGVLNGALTRMVAVDPIELESGEGFPASLVEIQGMGGFVGADLEKVAAEYDRVLANRPELTVNGTGRLTTPVGEMAWYDIVPGDRARAFARHYVMSAGDWAWVLVFWVSDLEASRPDTDFIASGFEPL